MASTETLQSVVNLAATHAELMPLSNVGGYANEPALSLCKDALQELLSGEFPWKFNNADMSLLVTSSNKQSYLFAGAVAWVAGKGGVGIGLASNTAISESGTTVTVTTLEAHGFAVGDTVYMFGNSVAAYNSTFTQTSSSSAWSGGWVITVVTSTTFTFEHATSGLAASGASGITDLHGLESATMVDMADTSSPQKILPVRTVRNIQRSSDVGTPTRVSVQSESAGVLTVRFYPVPGSTLRGVTLSYQKKAPTISALTDTWAPFPDELSFVYRQAFLTRCYRYLNDRRAEVEYQKLQTAIAKAMGNDDSEASDETIAPANPLMDWF